MSNRGLIGAALADAKHSFQSRLFLQIHDELKTHQKQQ